MLFEKAVDRGLQIEVLMEHASLQSSFRQRRGEPFEDHMNRLARETDDAHEDS